MDEARIKSHAHILNIQFRVPFVYAAKSMDFQPSMKTLTPACLFIQFMPCDFVHELFMCIELI